MRPPQVAPLTSVAPSPALSPPSRAWVRVLHPIEWRGSYSVEKLLGLLAYKSNHCVRAWLVLLLTPLPPLVACLFSELVVPLADPTLGFRRNGAFLVRTWIRSWLTAFSIDTVNEFYIPQIRLPRYRLLLMNAVQGALASTIIAVLAEVSRVFPVPFTPAASMPLYGLGSFLLRYTCDYHHRQRDTDPHVTKGKFKSLAKVGQLGAALIYAYSVFATVFAHVPDGDRPLMLLVLVAIKSISTRLEWRLAQPLTASGRNDLGAVHVAFGTQIFHGLFVCSCLQRSRSTATMVVVIIVTAAMDLTMIHELTKRTLLINRLAGRLGGQTSTETLQNIARRWRRRASADKQAASSSPLSLSEWCGAIHDAEWQSTSSTDKKMHAPLLPQETEYLEAVKVLFQCREATLLRMYVDMFVPLVFFAYVAAMKFLPNGQFVPFVQTNDLNELAVRLGVPLLVKAVTFGVVLRTFRHTSDLATSGLKQLAFALDRMATVIQARCLFIMLCVFDFTLLHNGNDLTFEFKWLRAT